VLLGVLTAASNHDGTCSERTEQQAKQARRTQFHQRYLPSGLPKCSLNRRSPHAGPGHPGSGSGGVCVCVERGRLRGAAAFAWGGGASAFRAERLRAEGARAEARASARQRERECLGAAERECLGAAGTGVSGRSGNSCAFRASRLPPNRPASSRLCFVAALLRRGSASSPPRGRRGSPWFFRFSGDCR
jgi:hypothetical protein